MFAPWIDVHDVNGMHWVNLWSELVALQGRRAKTPKQPLLLLIHEEGRVIRALRGGIPIPADFEYPGAAGLHALAKELNAGLAIGMEVDAIQKFFCAFEQPLRYGDDFLTLIGNVATALSRMSDVGIDVTTGKAFRALPPRLFVDQLFNLMFPDNSSTALYVFDEGKVYASLILSKHKGLLTRISTDDGLGDGGIDASRWREDLPRLKEEFQKRFGSFWSGIFVERHALQELVVGQLTLKEAEQQGWLVREPWPARFRFAEWVWRMGWGR